MLTYRAVALYCMVFNNSAFQQFRSKRLCSATLSNAYVADYQENVVTVVHEFVRCCNRWTTGKSKGALSALGRIVRTEIIACTITLLVQLKGVKEWIEWPALWSVFCLK